MAYIICNFSMYIFKNNVHFNVFLLYFKLFLSFHILSISNYCHMASLSDIMLGVEQKFVSKVGV